MANVVLGEPQSSSTPAGRPSSWRRAVAALFWPPLAPRRGEPWQAWWRVVCWAGLIPLTAMMHHAVFYPPTCMGTIVNPFREPNYPAVLRHWFLRDPSLPWAATVMLVVSQLGRQRAWLRTLFAPFFLAFLPLSVWIWDIPFSDHFICRSLHDGRGQLFGLALHTRYWYLLGILVFLAFNFYRFRRDPTGGSYGAPSGARNLAGSP